jgi:glycine/D-amino acid oxidase-like deaminating enzyme
MDRRKFLGATIAASFTGCSQRRATVAPAPAPPTAIVRRLTPVLAQVNRIFRVTVCVRPFRAAGPRLDVERVGDKTVVHNYGHGGSGWSLSWGSSSVAVEKAMAAGEREVGVIGCGALGLTSGILLQQAGAKVTIYAKERPHEARSARATGTWSPDSRIALTTAVNADFPAFWEKMCRKSFQIYGSYLGAPGNPVEWTDRYFVPSERPVQRSAPRADVQELPFAHYGGRVPDLNPRFDELPPGSHNFPASGVRWGSSLTFNIAGYSRQLVHDFLLEGGRIEAAEFHSPSDLSRLPQKVIINATGYGARALWKDESIVPVRGQIAWLIPQSGVTYGVFYRGIQILARRDGIVVQDAGYSEMDGYNDANEEPDRQKAEADVRIAAELFDRMRVTP